MSIPGSASPLFFQAAAGAGGYEIERSVRFNSADSAYLNRTPSSAGDQKTYTYSTWLKRSDVDTARTIFFAAIPTSSNYVQFSFNSNKITLYFRYLAGTAYTLTTVAEFRDTSAWYNVVIAVDSTQAVDTDRVKIYVNGVNYSYTGTVFNQNTLTTVNSTVQHAISSYQPYAAGAYFNGYLADVHFIDGQALDPTDFGEFDDNGVWQPIAYAGTYGTNGFHLFDFANVSGIGEDSSGNDNDWTVNNLTNKEVKTFDGIAVDGTDDYLSLSDDPDFDFGSGDFCMECWIKPSAHNTYNQIMNSYGASGNRTTSWNLYLGKNSCYFYHSGGNFYLEATATCPLDTWSHVAITREGNTFRLFTNGNLEDSTIQNVTLINSTADFTIGGPTNDFNGFYSNVRVVKGSAVYTTSFTPETSLTNITNTVLLCCQSNSSATAATVSPGTITANGNVFAGTFNDSTADIDVLFDSPTNGTQEDTGAGGQVSGNYCTWNPLCVTTNNTLTNGNLEAAHTASTGWTGNPNGTNYAMFVGTIGVTSGKWYWEGTWTSATTGVVGIVNVGAGLVYYVGYDPKSVGYASTYVYNDGFGSAIGSMPSYAQNDIIGVAIDMDSGKLYFSVNGAFINSGDPVAGTGNVASGMTGETIFPAVSQLGSSDGVSFTANFGQRAFAYSAPSGYKALCTTNLPDPTIADGSDYFDVKTWSGTGAENTLTGFEFSPDMIWVKRRNNSYDWHNITDTVRGATNTIYPNDSYDETVASQNVKAFTSDGVTLGTFGGVNASGGTYVGWTWDAGSSTVSNTDGSITSSVRANPSAGFSIVTYTGTGSAATVGHGLNAAPEMILLKDRNASAKWKVLHVGAVSGADAYYQNVLHLDTNESFTGTGNIYPWGGTAPTSSVFSVANASTEANRSGSINNTTYVAYCFAPVEGYSAFGSYEGNGSTDGPFIYTGFRPRWVMYKSIDTTKNWQIQDTERDSDNPVLQRLSADLSDAEYTGTSTSDTFDALSNGFKIRGSNNGINQSSTTYIYAAFAENPFKTARAR